MAGWWASLESLLRTQSILVIVGTTAALLAAGCGLFGYVVNNRIASLRRAANAEVSASQSEASQLSEQDEQLRAQLEEKLNETRELLDASESRSEGFLDRIDELELQLQTTTGEREQWRQLAEDRKPPSPPADGFLTSEQRAKFIRALQGSAGADLTVITVAGSSESRRFGNQLAELMREAGWNAAIQEESFSEPPSGHTFIVHSQESTPESALSLSVAMAIVEMAPFPPRVVLNPNQQPGFLGLVVVP